MKQLKVLQLTSTSTSTSSTLEIVRSYANNSTNTEREMGGNCMVCYVELDIFNIVNMECGHKMCNKCFPRWMSTNASCPSCRYKMGVRVQLTDEELQREIGQLHSIIYIRLINFSSVIKDM